MVETIRFKNQWTKIKMCLFYKHELAVVSVKIGSDQVMSKDTINVLGVIFDSLFCWSKHITNAIMKSNKRNHKNNHNHNNHHTKIPLQKSSTLALTGVVRFLFAKVNNLYHAKP
jgi:hypothetical protein